MSYSPKELFIFLGAIFQRLSLNFISILHILCMKGRAVAHLSAFVPPQYFYFHWRFFLKKSPKNVFFDKNVIFQQ